MEDIDSIVDQVLAGHSTSHFSAPVSSPPPQVHPVRAANTAAPSRGVPPVSDVAPQGALSRAPPGSVEEMVERILRGEPFQETGRTSSLHDEPEDEDAEDYEDNSLEGHVPHQVQRVEVPGRWRAARASPSVAVPDRSRQPGRRVSPRADEDDPLLRRFALWQERKDVKRIQAIYEALLEEKCDCPFQPDLRPESLLFVPERGRAARSVKMPATRGEGASDSMRFTGGAGGVARSTSSRVRDRASSHRSPTWQSLLAPSPLYEQNQAWGYDAHVERLRAAQLERESREREEEYARTRYADFSTFKRGPTKFEPFHLSTSNLGHARAGLSSSAVASTMRAPLPTPGHTREGDTSPGDRRAPSSALHTTPVRAAASTSPALAMDSAFDTLAPQIRQALLFTPQMNERLRQATAATQRSRHHQLPPHHSDPPATSSVASVETTSSRRGDLLPPTGHFSSTSASLLQLL